MEDKKMRKKLIIVIRLFVALVLISTPSFVFAAAMTDYCLIPPFINTIVPPNIMLLVDVSGSMSYMSYQATSYGTCSNNSSISCLIDSDCGGTNTCNPRDTYEGYFVPDKRYVLDTDGIYYEYAAAGVPCVIKYTYPCKKSSGAGCTTTKPADALNTCSGSNKYYCTPKGNPTSRTGDCGGDATGNWLNYQNMERIDLLRWAITGGSPSTCTSSDWTQCDPRVYKDSGMASKVGSVCKDNLKLKSTGALGHGCILMTDNSTKVSVPWSRIKDGLAFQFEGLPVQPRIGAMFFDGSGVRPNSVYVGDFTGANSRSSYTYQNLLTEVNASDPGGYTPTGPAFWEALNYLSQKAPKYGGIPEQSGSGDKWKNPMYDCPDKGGLNCNYIPCTKNFVMVMSDGLWNQGGVSGSVINTCNINTGFENSSADPVVPSYKMHMGFLNTKVPDSGQCSLKLTKTCQTNKDCGLLEGICNGASSVEAVYALGLFISTEGEKALQNIALYGSFDRTKLWPSNRTNYPGKQAGDPSNCVITSAGASCPGNQGTGSNCNSLPASSTDWDKNADGKADTYYYGDDALSIRSNLMNAVLDMISRASSGTAASVLASSEGRGANILQALFHPKKPFDGGTSAEWIGQMQNLWFSIDPWLKSNAIREDTVQDKILNTTNDKRIIFKFDESQNKAIVNRYDNSGNKEEGDLNVDEVSTLWEAGDKLFSRNLTTTPRTIKTTLKGSSPYAFTDFTPGNAAALAPYLQATTTTEAIDIINYVLGYDNVCTGTTNACTSDAVCGGALDSCLTYRSRTVTKGSTTGVWKLGDIVSSTPKIQSSVAVGNYSKTYFDTTYSSFTNSTNYKKNGTAYVGANDGMLHAINFGVFEEAWSGQGPSELARLTAASTADFGKERWAFIPKNMLPYLKYLADPEYADCHLFYVDASPVIVDASINPPTGCSGDYWQCERKTAFQGSSNNLDLAKTSWRTLLVGSMRFGGACRGTTTVCADVNGDGQKDCVNTPVDVTESGVTKSIGYSSYFALDITEQDSPKLLWEFSDPALGFSSPGPEVMLIAGRKNVGATSEADSTKNGRWFAVLASGPTGPVKDLKFQAHSDQNLKVFILDLKTGELLTTISTLKDGTTIQNAFAGSLLGGSVDYDKPVKDSPYHHDALYFGYTNKCTATTNICDINTWNNGGVLRLSTNKNLSGTNTSATGNTALNPKNWNLSKVISDIGPVAASVGHGNQFSSTGKPEEAWLFFGTGRYFYQGDDTTKQRTLFGVMEPCVDQAVTGIAGFAPECTLSRSFCGTPVSGASGPLKCGDLYNSTVGVRLEYDSLSTIGAKGWYISLEGPDNDNVPFAGKTITNITPTAERVITNPLVIPNGCVFFTTFAPDANVCAFGGRTWIWRVTPDRGAYCDIGLLGTGLIQPSTGAIEEVDMKTGFKDKVARIDESSDPSKIGTAEVGGRRSDVIPGVPPPDQGLGLVVSPSPIDKVIQIQKK
jgi:type IV pilus assembly protein PilY1